MNAPLITGPLLAVLFLSLTALLRGGYLDRKDWPLLIGAILGAIFVVLLWAAVPVPTYGIE